MKIEDVSFVDNELNIKTDLGSSNITLNSFDVNLLRNKTFETYDKFLELKGVVHEDVGRALLFGDYWSYINAGRRSLPRVMSVCLEKTNGFSQYMLLSLDTKEIVSAVLFNEKIKKVVEKGVKTGFFMKKDIREEMLDIEIFQLIDNTINSLSNIIDFNVKLGINFNATNIFDGDFYCYNDSKFNPVEHLDNVVSFIDKFDVCYVENVFVEKDFELYSQLGGRVRDRCLVNSKEGNCYLLKSKVFFSQDELLDLKNKYINLIVDVEDVNFDINFAVGFGIPIIKVRENVLDVLERIKKQMTLLPKPI